MQQNAHMQQPQQQTQPEVLNYTLSSGLPPYTGWQAEQQLAAQQQAQALNSRGEQPGWPQPLAGHQQSIMASSQHQQSVLTNRGMMNLAWATQHPSLASLITHVNSAHPTVPGRQQSHLVQQGYIDGPYYDVSSLSAPSMYAGTSVPVLDMHHQQQKQHQQQQHQRQQQQQQSAADHLLSQLVNAASNGQQISPSSHASTALMLTSQMAALSLPNSTNMPHTTTNHSSQQPHLNTSQLDSILLDSDPDPYATMGLNTTNNTTMDLRSSGSLTNLLAAGAEGAQNSTPGTSASLYVKNLSPDADELYLYQKFAPHGALLSCKVKTDPTTGKCRGVGFVNYVDQAAALRAMQQLHGSRTAEGRQLHITLQAPRAVRAAAAAAAAATVSPRADPGGPRQSLSLQSTMHDLVPTTTAATSQGLQGMGPSQGLQGMGPSQGLQGMGPGMGPLPSGLYLTHSPLHLVGQTTRFA